MCFRNCLSIKSLDVTMRDKLLYILLFIFVNHTSFMPKCFEKSKCFDQGWFRSTYSWPNNFLKAPLAPKALFLREKRAPKESDFSVKSFQKALKRHFFACFS